MSITFGSVGDIISVCLVVKDLIQALDEARGSPSEYQNVKSELHALDRALLQLGALSERCQRSADYVALGHTLKLEATECKSLVEGFLNKIKKYNCSLKQGGSGNVAKDTYWKLHWRLTHKDCLAKFGTAVQGRTAAITLLLVTSQFRAALITDEQLRTHLSDDSSRNSAFALSTEKSLDEIRRTVNAVEIRTKMLNWIGVGYIDKLHSDVGRKVELILKICRETWQAVHVIQTALPRILNPWNQQPAILDDAHGRVFQIPLDLIDSWELFESILVGKFTNQPGFHKVKKKEYSLHDSVTKRDIGHTSNWSSCFRPGRRILMSMIFSQQEHEEQTCPSCGTLNSGTGDSEIICSTCELQYQRIAQLHDAEGQADQEISGSAPAVRLPSSGVTKGTKKKRKRLQTRTKMTCASSSGSG